MVWCYLDCPFVCNSSIDVGSAFVVVLDNFTFRWCMVNRRRAKTRNTGSSGPVLRRVAPRGCLCFYRSAVARALRFPSLLRASLHAVPARCRMYSSTAVGEKKFDEMRSQNPSLSRGRCELARAPWLCCASFAAKETRRALLLLYAFVVDYTNIYFTFRLAFLTICMILLLQSRLQYVGCTFRT